MKAYATSETNVKIGDQKMHHVIASTTNYEWFYSMNLLVQVVKCERLKVSPCLSTSYSLQSRHGSNVTAHEFYAWNLVVKFNFDLKQKNVMYMRNECFILNFYFPSDLNSFFFSFTFYYRNWSRSFENWQSSYEHEIWFWDWNKMSTLSLAYSACGDEVLIILAQTEHIQRFVTLPSTAVVVVVVVAAVAVITNLFWYFGENIFIPFAQLDMRYLFPNEML